MKTVLQWEPSVECNFAFSVKDAMKGYPLEEGLSLLEEARDRYVLKVGKAVVKIEVVHSLSRVNLILEKVVLYSHWPSVITYQLKSPIFIGPREDLILQYYESNPTDVILQGFITNKQEW